MLRIRKVNLSECATLEGLVVVIDVPPAFTTAAYAFGAGAHEIVLVGEIDEAFRLHRERPHTLLMGERQGRSIPVFTLAIHPSNYRGRIYRARP